MTAMILVSHINCAYLRHLRDLFESLCSSLLQIVTRRPIFSSYYDIFLSVTLSLLRHKVSSLLQGDRKYLTSNTKR